MWSSIKIAALALGVVALSSNHSGVSAQTTSTTTTSSSSSTTTCEVGGLKVSTNFRYVTGRKGIEGSIYATCAGDKPKCFVDTRVRDAATAESISCDDNVIHESRRRLGVYMSGADHYWPQGVACYSYGSEFTATQQGVFTSAMNEYHTKTAVRFVTLDECKAQYPTACGGCTQNFQIVSASGANDCFATLGYAPNSRMDLNFGSGCFNGDGGFRVAVHELGHVVGLIHEHTHPNREVVVLRSDLTLSPDNYMKEKNGATTAYDSGSVMHYSRETGICIPKNLGTTYCDIDQSESDGCVVPTSDMCDDAQDTAFGRATTLAASDIATIAKIYGSGGQVATSTPATAAPTPATAAPTTAPVTEAPTPATTSAPVAATPAPSTPTSVPVPPSTQAPSTPVTAPVTTQAPYTPVMTPVATPAPAVQTPAPAPVAEPTQDPSQDTATDNATNTWDNKNQQSQLTNEYPVASEEESKSLEDPTDELSDSEVRGAMVTLAPATTTTGDSPVQVPPPAPAAATPAPIVAASAKGKKPRICDY
ncbi:hypothetical protein Gpo141_00011079 [Globisporangium polare]